MGASAWVVLGVVAIGVVVGVKAYRSRRPGESFEEAWERVLNTDAHQERERARLAGLSTPKPAAPPEDETTG